MSLSVLTDPWNVCMYICIILLELINNKKKCMGVFRNEDRISKRALNAKLEGILLSGSLKSSWE